MLYINKNLNQYGKLIIILCCFVGFSGCASYPWSKNSSGEYDFFLKNSKGEKPKSINSMSSETALSIKEAKLKANAAMQAGDVDSALFYYVKVLEKNQKDEESLTAIATIHTKRGNNDLAILAYRMVLGENEEHQQALEGLGLALIRVNKFDKARLTLFRALRDNPQHAAIYNGLGVISDIQHFYSEARWFYGQSLKMQADSPITRTNIAYSYFLSGEWDKAEKLYRVVLERFPKHAQASLNYALLLARKGKLFDAMSNFERVLEKPQAYNELGYILMLDKKYTMAEQLFQKAISSSPSYFEKAYKNLERLRELKAKKIDHDKTV